MKAGPFTSRGKGECRGGEAPSAGVWGHKRELRTNFQGGGQAQPLLYTGLTG